MMSRRALSLVAALGLTLTAQACCGNPPPDVVAEQYLRAGTNPDPAAAKAFVDPACHDKEEGRVEAVRMMGIPMKLEKLSVTVDSVTDETAVVSYTAQGSVEGEGGKTKVFGVDVTAGKVSIKDAKRTGQLKLKKIEGIWKVTCE